MHPDRRLHFWHNVPANYGTKSTVHWYHLELCEKGVYQAIFLEVLRSGSEIQKIDLSHCTTDTKDIPAKKRGSTGYGAYKKVKENKLSALVDRHGFLLACTIFPANIPDSRLYEPTLEAFAIPEMQVHSVIISADTAYDAREIPQYSRNRGIKSNIPVNRRSRKQPKRGGHSGLIRNSTRSAVLLNGSSVGLRHLRRFIPAMSAMRPHSLG